MTTAITERRLQNQRINQNIFDKPAQVASWFGAMQAQDWPGVKWAVGLRCRAATEETVDQAVADGAIIRTWLLRGTLQIAAADDVRWMLALLAPRLLAQSARRRKQLELDDAVLARSFDIMRTVLQEHQMMTRAKLLLNLEQAGISAQGARGYHILRHAGLSGLICFGPMQEKEQTFVLLDEWMPQSRDLDDDEALAELARRYFNSHGPAVLQDFVWWSGLPAGKARASLALVQPQLASEEIEGETYWQPQSEFLPDEPEPEANLLPAYDEYYLGYKNRDAVMDAGYDKKAVSSSGVFRPMLVIEGQIVGTWKRTDKKEVTVIELNLFRALSDDEYQAVRRAADQYGRYLEREVIIC